MNKLIFVLLAILTILQNALAQQKNMEFYINQAIQNSPILKDYQNQIQSNQIDSMRIRAGIGPQVNAVSNSSYAPVINGFGYDEAITNGANINALLSVSHEIIGKRNLQNQYEAIRWENKSILTSFNISKKDLVKSVTDQYISAFGNWQQYVYNVDIANLMNKEEQILKKLTEQGVYKQTEYLSFVTLLQQQELLVLQNRIQFRSNFSTLKYLCGITDTSFFTLSEPDLTPVNLPGFEKTIYYEQFVNDSLMLANGDNQIDFSYKPKVSVFADAGYNSSLVYKPWNNFGASVGLNISVPIYDGRQRKMQHDKIVIAQQTRKNYRDFYTQQYTEQISQLFEQLEDNMLIARQTEKQIKYSQTLVDAYHKLIETGETSLTDYILAINNLINIKSMLVQNSVEKYRIINQINYWSQN